MVTLTLGLGCMPESNQESSKILLKPNTRRLTDFVCYSSAHDLIKSTLTDIVGKFPAELYVTNKTLLSTGIFDAVLTKSTPYINTRICISLRTLYCLLQKVPESTVSTFDTFVIFT